MDRAGFERLVERELEALPAWVRAKLGNLAVIVEEHSAGTELLGLYETFEGYSRILLYRRTIAAEAWDEGDLPRVVRETLAHEIGHHFGMSEEEMEVFERAWEKDRG